MNNLSKRIRKFKKKQQVPQKEEIQGIVDPEQLTACYANISSDLSEKQFAELVSGDVINQMIQYLRNHNEQVILNALYALQNILRIGQQFSDTTAKVMQTLNLLHYLIQLPLTDALIAGYLNLAVEIFETWELTTTEAYYQHLLPILHKVMTESQSQEILIEALNLLQIFTEIKKFDLSPFTQAIKAIFDQSHPVMIKLNFAQQLRMKTLLLISLFNNNYHDQILFDLVRSVLGNNLYNELTNVESFIKKPTQQMEEEETEENDGRLQETLDIWECSAQSLIQVTLFLQRVYELQDDDEDAKQPQFQNKDTQPQFFTFEFLKFARDSLVRLLDLTSLLSLPVLSQQTSFTGQILNLVVQIIINSLNILSAIIIVIPNDGIPQLLQQQITVLLSSTVFDPEDQEQIANNLLKLLNLSLNANQALNPIEIVPELFISTIYPKLISTDSQFHILQLMKFRYSWKVPNSLERIEEVTNLLLQIMNKNNILLTAQALDCLYDIYTEEDYNQVLIKLNMMTLLNQGYKYLKGILPQEQKNLSKDDYQFVKLTLTNLQRFIEYKMKLL